MAVGWSAVCDCGISQTYSLIFFKYIITNPEIFLLLLGSENPFYFNVEGESCHSFIAHLFLSLILEYVPDALLEEGATPLLVEPITSEGDRTEEGVHK